MKMTLFRFWVMFSSIIFIFSLCNANKCKAADVITFKGKIWQQSGDGKKYTWKQANAYCENLEIGGYSDWHLPSYEELRELIVCTPRNLPPSQVKAGGSAVCEEDNSNKRRTKIDSRFNISNAGINDLSIYWAKDSKKVLATPEFGQTKKANEEIQYRYLSFTKGGMLMHYPINGFVSGDKLHYVRCVRP